MNIKRIKTEALKWSETKEKTKKELIADILKANSILEAVKKSNNVELVNKFTKEYNELEIALNNALSDDKKIILEELAEIKLELSDINYLAEDNNLIEWESYLDSFKNTFSWDSTESLKEKSIHDYTVEEAEWALKYLNKKYSNLDNVWDVTKFWTNVYIWNNTINSIDDKYDALLMQKKITNKILWWDSLDLVVWLKTYNHEYISGFNNNKWNYIENINVFENKIKNTDISIIDWITLWNYISMLEEKWNLTYESLINKFWMEKTEKIINKNKETEIDSNYINASLELITNAFSILTDTISIYFSSLLKWSFLDFSEGIKNMPEKRVKEFKEEISKDKNRVPFIKNSIEGIINSENEIDPIHQDIILENLQIEVIKSESNIKNILEKAWWNKEKIELFIEKIKNSQFQNPKDLVIFIKDLQEQDPLMQSKTVKNITQSALSLESIIETQRTIKSHLLTSKEKKDQFKYKSDNIKISTTILNDTEIVSLVMNSDASTDQEYNNLINTIVLNNESLRIKLSELELYNTETYNDFFKDNSFNTVDNLTDETSIGDIPIKTITYNDWSELNYFKTWDWYNIDSWELNGEWIEISEKEFATIKENPEAKENLIHFHDFFKKLNLESVWEYRDQLILAIWNINIKPNDSDFIKDSELTKFWNKLLDFISNIENEWEWNKNNLKAVGSINLQLKKFSWASTWISDSKTFNIEWEDKLATYLRNQWIIWWAYFHTNKFRNIMNWENKKNS